MNLQHVSLDSQERQSLSLYAKQVAKNYLLKNVGNTGDDSTAPHIRDFFLRMLANDAKSLICVTRINGRISFSHDNIKMSVALSDTLKGCCGQFTSKTMEKCSKIWGNRF